MTTLPQLQKQIADLQKQADALLKTETTQAIASVKETIARYGLTAEDLGFSMAGGKKLGVRGKVASVKVGAASAKPLGVPKFRDPKTGKSWTGHGKQPDWFKNAKNKSNLRITTAASDTEPAAAPAPAQAPKAFEIKVSAKHRVVQAVAVPARKATGAPKPVAVTKAKKTLPVKAPNEGASITSQTEPTPVV